MSIAVVTCGVLVMNRRAELLMGHATGARHWDIPKGVSEPGEGETQAAARELFEETGLEVATSDLQPIGRFAYRPRKDLHLFGLLTDRFDPRNCICRSEFVDRRGRRRPEMDAFAWVAFAEVPTYAAASMTKVLTQVISLPAVLGLLEGDEMAGAPRPAELSASRGPSAMAK